MSAAAVNPRLPIRSRYRGPAFRAIEAILREDPTLAVVVRTWRSREGNDYDLRPVSADQCPMIALSPLPVASTSDGIDGTRINLKVAVETWVPGTCVDDLLALWEAIEDAVVQEKPFRGTTVRCWLNALNQDGLNPGVIRLIPEFPAFFPLDLNRPPDQIVVQGGTGTLTCFLRRRA